MSLPLHYTNAAGTLASSFSIGKKGPTIHQGTATPPGSLGSSGDLFLRHGGAPGFFQKRGNYWGLLRDNAYHREIVQSGGTHLVAEHTTSVAVILTEQIVTSTTASATTTGSVALVLPPAVEGKMISIKDEAGFGRVYPITVTGQDGDLIDGLAAHIITQPFGFANLLYTGNQWRVVGGVSEPLPATALRDENDDVLIDEDGDYISFD